MIIAKNIYSIKYLKKNRRAGKQLEKVLKSSADRVILRPCLAERWVITHETPLQAFANLGQSPSVWSGEAYHIENRQENRQEKGQGKANGEKYDSRPRQHDTIRI